MNDKGGLLIVIFVGEIRKSFFLEFKTAARFQSVFNVLRFNLSVKFLKGDLSQAFIIIY